MANRTIQLYGKVYGDPANPGTMTMNFNGQSLFSGTVTTAAGPVNQAIGWADMTVLATATIDTSISGSTPLQITVSNGDMIFHTFHGNYFGDVVSGNVVVTPSVDNVQDLTGPSTMASGGYDNVTIGGVANPRVPTNESEALGKWNYLVPDGLTFACDVQVQPAVDVPT